jgi:hypothetical protein
MGIRNCTSPTFVAHYEQMLRITGRSERFGKSTIRRADFNNPRVGRPNIPQWHIELKLVQA